MASITKVVEDRFASLLLSAGGSARTIPSTRFRRCADRMSLADPNHPDNPFDRAYELQYLSLADHDQDKRSNPLAPAWLLDLLVNVRVGYLVGAATTPGFAQAAGTAETAAFGVLNARARALNDAQRIWRTVNTNFRDTTGDPQIVDAKRVGAAVVDDLGNGRLICTSTFMVILALDPAQDYDPSE